MLNLWQAVVFVFQVGQKRREQVLACVFSRSVVIQDQGVPKARNGLRRGRDDEPSLVTRQAAKLVLKVGEIEKSSFVSRSAVVNRVIWLPFG